MAAHLVVLVTCPNRRTATHLATLVVTRRFAACVNIIPNLHSVFRWQGTVDTAREVLLIIKTSAPHFESLRRAIVNAHPYDVPEVIALPIVKSHRPYATWITDSVRA